MTFFKYLWCKVPRYAFFILYVVYLWIDHMDRILKSYFVKFKSEFEIETGDAPAEGVKRIRALCELRPV